MPPHDGAIKLVRLVVGRRGRMDFQTELVIRFDYGTSVPWVSRRPEAVGDRREVICDPEARYFGGRVEERSLAPVGEARLGRIGLDEWLRRARTAA